MASTTRDFNILLTVRADLRDALGKISSVDSSLKGLKSTALEVASALGIGFSIAGIVDFIKNTIQADVQLGNLSKTLGLSTEQLSTLQDQAKKAGLSIDDVQTALVALSKAATGQNAEGAKALQAIGVSAKDAQGNIKPMAQLLQEVASKFAGYNAGTTKAADATALFGRAGAQLIPLLDQVGNQGLANLTQQAIAAGTAVDSKAVAASQHFSNAMDDLKSKLQGAANQGLAQFTPEIEHLAKLIDDPEFSRDLQNVADGIVAIARAAAGGVTDLVKFIGTMQDLAGFSLDQHVGGEASYQAALTQLQQLQAEQQRRQSGGALGQSVRAGRGAATAVLDFGIPGFAGVGDVDQQLQNVASGYAATFSDEVLAQTIAKLKAETAAYRNSSGAPELTSDQLKAQLEAALPPGPHSKTNAPIIGGAGDKTVDSARAAAAALQALQNQLASLRTQGLDPAQTAWAEYNKTVDQAVEEAKKAGNTPEANTALNAVVEQAARIRDAKLDDILKQDQKAWEDLQRSLETPAEANVDDAIDAIQQLNGFLQRGVINSQQYHDALQKIGAKAAGDLPDIEAPRIGGVYGDLAQTYKDEANLLQSYQEDALALKNKFRHDDAAQEEAYQAALADMDASYAKNRQAIEENRQQLQLESASEFFGQLATLSSSHNKRIATIGKAAAIAQAIINTYQSATEAYKSLAGIPYIGPALGVAAAAAAIAAGLANVAQIRAQPIGGYSKGGYTGGGGVLEPAGIVHKGEVVWSQQDIQRAGGVNIVEAMRTGTAYGYADGGVVGNVPVVGSLAQAINAGRSTPGQFDRAGGGSGDAGSTKHVLVFDRDQLAQEILSSKAGEKVIVHTVADNPTAIQAKWGR